MRHIGHQKWYCIILLQDLNINADDILNKEQDERNSYLLLCRLLTEGVTYTLRNVFDRLYPPGELHDRLNTLQVS